MRPKITNIFQAYFQYDNLQVIKSRNLKMYQIDIENTFVQGHLLRNLIDSKSGKKPNVYWNLNYYTILPYNLLVSETRDKPNLLYYSVLSEIRCKLYFFLI